MVSWPLGAARTRFLALALSGVTICLALQAPLLTFYRVSGNSMRPAYEDGDRVLVLTLPALAGGIGVGDAVIAEHDGEALIKRVMATPGDSIEMRDGTVFLNGTSVRDPVPVEFRGHGHLAPLRLRADQYFVLGDNRDVSVDSRCLGAIDDTHIVGKVLIRFSRSTSDRSVTARELENGTPLQVERE
jgi:signal peptidase I